MARIKASLSLTLSLSFSKQYSLCPRVFKTRTEIPDVLLRAVVIIAIVIRHRAFACCRLVFPSLFIYVISASNRSAALSNGHQLTGPRRRVIDSDGLLRAYKTHTFWRLVRCAHLCAFRYKSRRPYAAALLIY